MVIPRDQKTAGPRTGTVGTSLVAGVLFVLAPTLAFAHPIRHQFARSDLSRERVALRHQIHASEAFLSPAAVHHRVTTARVWPGVYVTAIDGLLPRSALVTYLDARRALNPKRFDHYHPRLGPMVALDETIRASHPAPHRLITPHLDTRPATSPTVPTTCDVTPTVTELIKAQQVVPEPGAATIALALIASVALARRFRRGIRSTC